MITQIDDERHGAPHADDDLSLQDAARLYDVPYKTLGKRVRYGEIEAYKARGPWGQEWRVSRQALEDFGYQARRSPAPCAETEQDARVAALQVELVVARRAAACERNRAEEADRKLGAALLECGRLRAALTARS